MLLTCGSLGELEKVVETVACSSHRSSHFHKLPKSIEKTEHIFCFFTSYILILIMYMKINHMKLALSELSWNIYQTWTSISRISKHREESKVQTTVKL